MKWNSKTIKHIATTGVLSGINIDSFFLDGRKEKGKSIQENSLFYFFKKIIVAKVFIKVSINLNHFFGETKYISEMIIDNF